MTASYLQGSCKKSILLVRLALFYVMVHGFGPNLAVVGPKLDPTFFEQVGRRAGRRSPRNGRNIVSLAMGWQDSSMDVHLRTKKIVRLALWMGFLCLEAGLVLAFYVVPQFQARNAPPGHWEMETPRLGGVGLWVALILAVAIFTLGNIGLILIILRRYKELKAE